MKRRFPPRLKPQAVGGGMNLPMVMAIHEADGQNVTVQEEIAYSLATGGGKPGQGYPCVMIYEDTDDCK